MIVAVATWFVVWAALWLFTAWVHAHDDGEVDDGLLPFLFACMGAWPVLAPVFAVVVVIAVLVDE